MSVINLIYFVTYIKLIINITKFIRKCSNLSCIYNLNYSKYDILKSVLCAFVSKCKMICFYNNNNNNTNIYVWY